MKLAIMTHVNAGLDYFPHSKDFVIYELFTRYLSSFSTSSLKNDLENLDAVFYSDTQKVGLKEDDPYALVTVMEANPNDEQKCLDAFYDAIIKMQTVPMSDVDLMALKNNIKKDYTYAMQNSEYNGDMLGNSLRDNSLEYYLNYNQILDSITQEDILNFANKYFNLNRASIVVIHPTSVSESDIKRNYLNSKYSMANKVTGNSQISFGSIKNVLMADKNRLMTVDGIKENSATLITLVNSLFKYISKPNEGDVISSVIDAKKYCKTLFVGADVEQFYVICLSKGNMVKAVKSIQTGTSDEIAVQIRTITEFALESKCNRIIITHNHPFGSATMSDEDYSFTYSLICSCLLNSIDVVDHIIVGMDSVNSFAAQKLLNQLKNKAVKNINIPITSLKILSSYEEEYVIDDNK